MTCLTIAGKLNELKKWANNIDDQNTLPSDQVEAIDSAVQVLENVSSTMELTEKQDLSALKSRIVVWKTELTLTGQRPEPREEKRIAIVENNRPQLGAHKVRLHEATQQQMTETPAACSFHAISAMKEIGSNFDLIFDLIIRNQSLDLSRIQQNIIQNLGLPLYQQAVAVNPDVVKGADFEHFKPFLPQEINLVQPPNYEKVSTLRQRIEQVVGHLSEQAPEIKTVWLKNGNDESFAVIGKGKRAIIFDSHKNEIIGTDSIQGIREALSEKLGQYAQLDGDQYELNRFEFALTGEPKPPQAAATGCIIN